MQREQPAQGRAAHDLAASGLADALTQPGAGGLLEVALAARFGRVGYRVDLASADALGVSPRTVRRWLHDRPDRSGVPARRLEQLMTVLAPTAATRRREELDLEQAEQGLSRIRMGARRGDHAQWANTGWLQPHTVAVLDLPDIGLRRVAVTRDSAATTARMRRGAVLLDQVTVSNRFAATVVRHQVLEQVFPWRVEAGPAVLAKGHTQVWLTSAPLPSLEVLAHRRFRPRASAVS